MHGFKETDSEMVHTLDSDAYKVFEQKGGQNAVKVRRILQLTNDLAHGKISELKILDLGCAEGVYAIEAALRGAHVVAIDGRRERLRQGCSISEKMGLTNITFLQQDVRHISKEQFGEFDVVYFLGLLYHLDAADVFAILPKVYDLCTGFMIIDTCIAFKGNARVFNGGSHYDGRKIREHQKDDSPEMIRSRLSSSLGNIDSFRFTKQSLLKLLHEIGFSTILECDVPFELTKEKEKGERITFVAIKGQPVKIASYPWLNGMSEEHIREKMQDLGPW